MQGSTYSRFKTEDCEECKLPFEEVVLCEVCEKPFCVDCTKYWKTCPECQIMGCKEHFDGMYCKECVKEK